MEKIEKFKSNHVFIALQTIKVETKLNIGEKSSASQVSTHLLN